MILTNSDVREEQQVVIPSNSSTSSGTSSTCDEELMIVTDNNDCCSDAPCANTEIIDNSNNMRRRLPNTSSLKRSRYNHLQQHDNDENDSSHDGVVEESLSSFTGDGIMKGNNGEDEDDKDDDVSDLPQLEDWLSNFCFLLGSILFVWLAIWDINYDATYDIDDIDDGVTNDDNNNNNNIVVIVWKLVSSSPYVSVTASAALFYVFDSLIQVWKFIRLTKKISTKQQQPIVVNTNDNDAEATSINDRSSYNNSSVSNQAMTVATTASKTTSIVLEINQGDEGDQIEGDGFIRPNDFGHGHQYSHIVPSIDYTNSKRSYSVEVLAVLTFGGGALFELIGALMVDSNEITSDMMFMLGVHFYLANAVIVMTPMLFQGISFKDLLLACSPYQILCCCCKRHHCCGSSINSYTIEKMGDFLFLTGSMIDVILSYWDLELKVNHKILVDGLNLLSALLWFIDAICFIAADYIAYKQYHNNNSLKKQQIQQQQGCSNDKDNIIVVNPTEGLNDNYNSIEPPGII